MSAAGNGTRSLVSRRPAESTGLAGAIVVLIVHLVGVTNPDVIVSLAVVVGSLPAIVTWVIAAAGSVRRRPPAEPPVPPAPGSSSSPDAP